MVAQQKAAGLVAVLAAVLACALFARAAGPAPARRDGPAVMAAGVSLEVLRDGRWQRVDLSLVVAARAGVEQADIEEALAGALSRFGAPVRAVDADRRALMAARFAWAGGTATFAYNPSGRPDSLAGEEAALVAAAGEWGRAGAAFGFVYSGLTDADTGACSDDSVDGRNTVGWRDQAGRMLALTCSWYDGGRAVEFDTEFDPGWDWTAGPGRIGADFESVALHELGHAAGLEHTANNAAVMYGTYYLGTRKVALHASDREALLALYGEPSATPTPTATPPTQTPSPAGRLPGLARE